MSQQAYTDKNQGDPEKTVMDPQKVKRKLQEKLGKARDKEEKSIREEFLRMTHIASARRMQLMAKEGCSIAA